MLYVIAWEDDNDADWEVVGDGEAPSYKDALERYELNLKNIIDDLNQEHAFDTKHTDDVPKDQICLLSFKGSNFDSDDDIWKKIDEKYLRRWSAKDEIHQAETCNRLPLMLAKLRYDYAIEIVQKRLMEGSKV